MKAILMSTGEIAVVDDDDHDWLSKFKWSGFSPYPGRYYARTALGGKWMNMHTMIMGVKTGKVIDHKNRNGLDNQRHNLRFCTQSQNLMNRPMTERCKTGFKGVHRRAVNGKYRALISHQGKDIYLGDFADPVSAAKAYNAKAMELDPEFAWLNPIPPNPL